MELKGRSEPVDIWALSVINQAVYEHKEPA
jgi:hypothetical protein